MKPEMATLYSRFAPRRRAVPVTNSGERAERAIRINRLFCDVFRQFRQETVAKRRHSSAAAATLLVVFLAGCAAGGGLGRLTADAPEDVKRDAVAARAKARWDALIKADLAGAYEYLSPASRATMPLDLYKAKHKVGLYRAIRIDNVSCQTDTCTVNLSLTYDFKRFKGVTTPLVEKWIITDGQAWFVDKG